VRSFPTVSHDFHSKHGGPLRALVVLSAPFLHVRWCGELVSANADGRVLRHLFCEVSKRPRRHVHAGIGGLDPGTDFMQHSFGEGMVGPQLHLFELLHVLSYASVEFADAVPPHGFSSVFARHTSISSFPSFLLPPRLPFHVHACGLGHRSTTLARPLVSHVRAHHPSVLLRFPPSDSALCSSNNSLQLILT